LSCLISDLVYYGCVTMPEADGVTVGGAINFNNRVEFNATALSPTTQFQCVSSSGSDTGVRVQISYRDSTGTIQTPAFTTVTGSVKATMTTVAAERLLSGVTSSGSIAGLVNPGGTTAVGDIAVISSTLVLSARTMQTGAAQATITNPPVALLQSGDGASVAAGMVLRTTGGTGPAQIRRILQVNPNGLGADYVAVNRNWATIPTSSTTYEVGYGMVFELAGSNQGGTLSGGTSTQCTGITRLFVGATANVAGGSTINFYDKCFIVNNNQTTALTSASVLIQSLTPGLPGTDSMNIALATALNDSTTIANRQTAPAAATAFTSGAPPQSVSVPAPGNLPASTGNGSPSGAQAIWVNLTAVAGSASWEGVPDLRTTGSST
jgi:hypothetical protein